MTRVRFRSYHAMFFGARILLVLLGATIGGAVLPARADVVTIWNEKAIEILPRMGKQGPFNLRGLAMMHAAMFDAVNAVERRYTPLKVDMTAPPGASAEAAAAAAARRILLELVPRQREGIDAVFRATVASIPDDDAKSRGTALGEDVAVKIALWRANDRSDMFVDYVPQSGPGCPDICEPNDRAPLGRNHSVDVDKPQPVPPGTATGARQRAMDA